MKKFQNYFFIIFLFLISCTKEVFAPNKAKQNNAINPLTNTCGPRYSQSTTINPKVDILLLWDNSSSATFINTATKNSFKNLIDSISEKFDYHILSAPLISTNSNSLFEASLVAKNNDGISTVLSYLKTKQDAGNALNFTSAVGRNEPGVDRVINIIESNRSNGIFRNDAYTIIVVMSNGDDTSCEISTNYNECSKADWEPRLQTKIDKLLCLRGNAQGLNCAGVTPLNSTMMRFMNIVPLTSCPSAQGFINTRYRKVAKLIYEKNYSNGWPSANDNLNPFTLDGVPYPDNFNICTVDLNHIFDGVNSAIKETIIKHVYDFWPVAGTNDSVDPDTIVVKRLPDGKILSNQTGIANPTEGFQYLGNQINHSTRVFPTSGENFTGKLIKLIGTKGNDLIEFPNSLQICYQDYKSVYGHIYLKNGKPSVSTIELYFNGVKVPQSTSNGWEYIGLKNTLDLDQNLKIVDLPVGVATGYFLKLNGSYQFKNDSTTNVTIYYISAP